VYTTLSAPRIRFPAYFRYMWCAHSHVSRNMTRDTPHLHTAPSASRIRFSTLHIFDICDERILMCNVIWHVILHIYIRHQARLEFARCSALQGVAVCYIVLQCVALCCSVLQCVAVCWAETTWYFTNTLQVLGTFHWTKLSAFTCVTWHTIWYVTYIATHCNTLQHTATHCNTLQHTATH